MNKPVVRKLRCAVYTRKSSEEGLEQEFNSLHAQREACAAYIAARRSGCDGRDNQDESDAPGADRGEGVARTKVCPGGALRRPSG